MEAHDCHYFCSQLSFFEISTSQRGAVQLWPCPWRSCLFWPRWENVHNHEARRSCGVEHVAADYKTLVASATIVEFLMNHHQLLVCLHWKWNFSSVLMVFCFVHFSIAGWNHMPYIATAVQLQWVYFRMTQITKTHKIHEKEFKTPPLIMASYMAWRKNYEINLFFLNWWARRHCGHLQNSSSESGVRGRVSFIPQSWSTVFRWGVKIQNTKQKVQNTKCKM